MSVTPATPDPIKDEQMINDAFRHLLDTYLASNHRKKTEVITKAFNFAKKAHSGVRRLSGEPYIMHPIAVAQIVCEEIGFVGGIRYRDRAAFAVHFLDNRERGNQIGFGKIYRLPVAVNESVSLHSQFM